MIKYFYNLGSYFIDVVNLNRLRPALNYNDRQYTYADLLDQVDRLSQLLINYGVQRGEVIAIGNNKQPLSYALMLAALRIGITYVNIDVASPLARNLRILEVSNAVLLFCDDHNYHQSMKDLANAHACKLVDIDIMKNSLPIVNEDDKITQEKLMRDVDGSCIAYVMFTSGSTGIPKGVAVTHQNVLHFIYWGRTYFNITDQDNFANLSPMYFDNSVFDFYIGLFSGASLSPIARELMNKPYDLVPYVWKMQCTIWFSVPSLLIYLMSMKAFMNVEQAYLRYIVFGGEGYPKIELKKLFDLFKNRTQLINVYGPTECTCICSAYELQENDFINIDGLPPLGQLNCNFDYKILDDQGVAADSGELCLIGPNVAAGYFNDLERTKESFVYLNETTRYMKAMYKTGDLVREVDGVLYFVGRKDNQIKHMGYRIELEEIECALIKLAYVNQAAVVYQRTNTTHGKILAFVSCSEMVAEDELLALLSEQLPSYMLPSRIVVSQKLPKNANGKVDKQQLMVLL